MKKIISIILCVVLLLSALPLNAFAIGRGSVVSVDFYDTYVYDGAQEENGKFGVRCYETKYTITFEDGSTYENLWGLDGVWVNGEYVGNITYSDTQDSCLWKVGNIYQVTGSIAGVSGTFNVEVRENPIEDIFVEDFSIVSSSTREISFLNLLSYRTWDVLFKDQSRETFDYALPMGYAYAHLSLDSSVSTQDWEAGNTYEVIATLLGVSTTFNVTVLEIESIAVDDVECIENFDGDMDGYWDEDGNYVDNTWFNYNIYPDRITVTFTDGSSISGEAYEIAEYTGSYPFCNSDQSYENQWGVGNHTATINICGYEQDYTVKVVETPIKEILVDDITHIEGTNCWIDHDTENPGWYCYEINPEELTVILKNDSEISGTLNEVCEQLGCWQNCTSDQSFNNQWGVGEHKATINLLGVTAEYKIIITESPVESLEIIDISIREKSTGWEEDGVFHYYNYFPDYTITMKDGSVVYNRGIEIDGEYYTLNINDSIQYDEPWTVGNTYEVTGSILGVSDTFNVTITENPIERIEIDDIEVIENTHGYYDEEYDCYIYDWLSPNSFTAILKDGRRIKSQDGVVNVDGKIYGISSANTNYQSQRETPWTAGNSYQISANVGGFSDTFNVKIVKSPVVSIDVEDVTCIEGTRGRYIIDDEGEDYYKYEDVYIQLDFTATLNDGTFLKAEGYHYEPGSGGAAYGIYIGEDFYEISRFIDNQETSHWGIGTHTVTAEFLGVTDEFNVTITESPVESVKVEDITLIQGIDSHINGDYDHYNFYPTYTVTFKDGTVKTFTDGSGINLGGTYYTYLETHYLQWETPFEAGNTYEILGTFGLATDTFKVTVEENPVSSIEVVKNPDKVEYVVGEYYDLKGAIIRVHYKDGAYEDIDINCTAGEHNDYISYYSEKLQRYIPLDLPHTYASLEIAGKYTINISMFEKKCRFSVNVVENPTESITIKENTDKSIIITVKNKDGYTYDMNVLDIEYWNNWAENNVDYARIFTDKGIFDAKIYLENNGFAIGLGNIGSDNFIKSNTLNGCEWYDVAKLIHYDLSSQLITLKNKLNHFTGKITADNIDKIVEAAGYMNHLWYTSNEIITETNDHTFYKGESVRETVKKYFAIDEIDLSLSKNYDPNTDTYRFKREGTGGYGFINPFKLSYYGGVWNANLTLFQEDPHSELTELYLKLDDKHRILNFYWGAGSVNHTYSGDWDNSCNICEDIRQVNYTGWVLNNGTWYYYENGNKVLNEWRKDSIGWVFLGLDGAMLTNAWCTDSAGWCYVGADGYAVTNCWMQDSIGWCYLGANGSQVKNDWILDGGKWYFIDENGYMVSDQWRKDSIGWVYLGSSGAMLTNAWCTDSQGWCYVGADGYAVTNCWKKDSIGWIWLNGSGSMTKSAWVFDCGSWYYLDSDGYMLSSTSRYISNKTYYFNASGVCTNP